MLARKFYSHGRFRWRVGRGDWLEHDRRSLLLDSVEIRPKLCVNWVSLGTLDLGAEEQTLEIETTGQGALCFDCFILTRKPFLARGKARPDEAWAEPEPGKWVFDPQPDDFSPDALLDLTYLNEGIAGEKGFVRLDESGNGFSDGRGLPLRFWCTTSMYSLRARSVEDASRHARFLAKRGVNLVQILGGYIGNGCYGSPEGEIHEINREYQEST